MELKYILLCTVSIVLIPGSELYFDKDRPVPEEVETQYGGHLVLYCEARGSPTPTIHWLFNGQRILQVSLYVGMPSFYSVDMINNLCLVNWTGNVLYFCRQYVDSI